MCFPAQFLQRYQLFATIIGFILSTIAIVLGVVQCFLLTEEFWKMTNYRWPIVSSVLLFISGLILFLFSLMGCWGIKRTQHGKFACYFYGIIFSFICFTILGVITLVHTNGISNQMLNFYYSNCPTTAIDNDISWLSQLAQVEQIAYQQFGNSQNCQVYLNQENYDLFSHFFDDPTTTQLANNTNVQACIPQYNNWNSILQHAEKSYQCSGMCKQIFYYMFTDINNGFTKQSCFNSFYNKVKDYGQINGIVACCIAGILLLNILSQICLCCNPQKLDKDFEDNPYLQITNLNNNNNQ